MRVICRKLIHYETGEEIESSFWLTLGKEYTVFSIILGPRYGISICIQGDGQAGVTYPGVEGFEFIEQKVPSTWITTAREFDGRQVMMLLPERWNYPHFEVALSAGDPKAYQIFCQEVEKIYHELGYDKKEWQGGLPFEGEKMPIARSVDGALKR